MAAHLHSHITFGLVDRQDTQITKCKYIYSAKLQSLENHQNALVQSTAANTTTLVKTNKSFFEFFNSVQIIFTSREVLSKYTYI